MNLTVQESAGRDTHKDMVRIHRSKRPLVGRNSLARITVNGTSQIFAVRGLAAERAETIEIDFEGRDRLGVETGKIYDFNVKPACLFEKIRWALRSSEPAYRIATQIAIWSFILGVVGLLSSLVPLWKN